MHKRIYPNEYRLMQKIIETFNLANLISPDRVNSAWCGCYTNILIKRKYYTTKIINVDEPENVVCKIADTYWKTIDSSPSWKKGADRTLPQ